MLIPEGAQGQAGWGPERPCLQQGLELDVHSGPFQPKQSCESVMTQAVGPSDPVAAAVRRWLSQ